MSYVQNNARLAAAANALQGKFALVREFDSLKLIYILSADCLLSPGSKRLTAFDIHIAASVYTRLTPSQFVISTAWKSFIAFDLVAVFALDGAPISHPPSFAYPRTTPVPPVVNAPSTWTESLDLLECSAGSYGGIEGLPCVFADEDVMAALLAPASATSAPTPTPTPTYRRSSCASSIASSCSSRRESYGVITPIVPSFSVSH